ncbi:MULTISPECIES: Gfo/Idh/MocA family protein [unclassified Leifsonia]|uniref:Gfo/Idh/MocA family protein n=1 Tax=unclassified Leifsonia TaxID=2663824 RepID=UPI0006FD7A8F|nr:MULTISPECIES: Gfo/Idh/MocA family oxidoreductase [unclassified Leifsonia]KQX08089.1 oxidoreductase [Leifsonia sp. Root1293]KRA12370.1 oxidoreductase [Leifsonia sp. Root60]
MTTTEPIRTAVIGFGTSGRVFHAPFLAANDEFSLDVVVTANPERRAEAERLHPNATVVDSPDDVLARAADLDLVVIGSPPETHAPLAEAALAAGLSVVVDKPFAVTAAEGRALIDAAAASAGTLTVFQNRRWDGDFLTLRRLIDAGELGEVRRFESRFEWWKPTPPATWKSTTAAASGGGILFDLGTHLIDQALTLFGPVVDVYAEVRTLRAGAGADDDAFVALTHASGTISHLWMSSLAAQFGPRFRVLGSEAGYTTWGLDPQEAALKAGGSPTDPGFGEKPRSAWGELGLEGATRREPTDRGDYAGFYRALADTLLRNAPVPVDPADSVRVLEIIEAVHARGAAHG